MNTLDHFHLVKQEQYPENPSVPLGQPFLNQAGVIQNLVLGEFTSAALITSQPGAVRANHYHKTDWHYSYVLEGEVWYYSRPAGNTERPKKTLFLQGTMFFSPPMVEHAMFFPKGGRILTFARNVRDHETHEADLVRVSPLVNPKWSETSGCFYDL